MNPKLASRLIVAILFASALTVVTEPLVAAPDVSFDGFANGALEGTPGSASGFEFFYAGSEVSSDAVDGVQSINLAKSGALPTAWSVLGNLRLAIAGSVRFAEVGPMLFSLKVSGTPPASALMQHYLGLDSNGDGARDACFVAEASPIAQTDGWRPVVVSPSVLGRMTDNACSDPFPGGPVSSVSLPMASFQAQPEFATANVLQVAFQVLYNSALGAYPGPPVLVDGFQMASAAPAAMDGFVASIQLGVPGPQPVIVDGGDLNVKVQTFVSSGAAFEADTGNSYNLVLQVDCGDLRGTGPFGTTIECAGAGDTTTLTRTYPFTSNGGEVPLAVPSAHLESLRNGLPATGLHIWVEGALGASNFATPTSALMAPPESAARAAVASLVDAFDDALWHPVVLLQSGDGTVAQVLFLNSEPAGNGLLATPDNSGMLSVDIRVWEQTGTSYAPSAAASVGLYFQYAKGAADCGASDTVALMGAACLHRETAPGSGGLYHIDVDVANLPDSAPGAGNGFDVFVQTATSASHLFLPKNALLEAARSSAALSPAFAVADAIEGPAPEIGQPFTPLFVVKAAKGDGFVASIVFDSEVATAQGAAVLVGPASTFTATIRAYARDASGYAPLADDSLLLFFQYLGLACAPGDAPAQSVGGTFVTCHHSVQATRTSPGTYTATVDASSLKDGGAGLGNGFNVFAHRPVPDQSSHLFLPKNAILAAAEGAAASQKQSLLELADASEGPVPGQSQPFSPVFVLKAPLRNGLIVHGHAHNTVRTQAASILVPDNRGYYNLHLETLNGAGAARTFTDWNLQLQLPTGTVVYEQGSYGAAGFDARDPNGGDNEISIKIASARVRNALGVNGLPVLVKLTIGTGAQAASGFLSENSNLFLDQGQAAAADAADTVGTLVLLAPGVVPLNNDTDTTIGGVVP